VHSEFDGDALVKTAEAIWTETDQVPLAGEDEPRHRASRSALVVQKKFERTR
jgi:hypothetical protein